VGKTFGYLTVLEYSHSNKGYTYWKCQCVCGTIKTKVRTNLMQSEKISCGCKTSENLSIANSNPKYKASFNEVYRTYKYRNKTRFNSEDFLTKDQFKKLIYDKCHYCGDYPSSKSNTHEKRFNGAIVYNGLDRVDNFKGYTLNNVVTCCGSCNKMKSTLTYEEFILQIGKIYARHQKKI